MSIAHNISASGSSRSNAVALNKSYNVVTKSSPGAGVCLPSAASLGVGNLLCVYNKSPNSLQVYATGNDKIDELSILEVASNTLAQFLVVDETAFVELPIGKAGPIGPQGKQGAQGPQGIVGAVGAKGDVGVIGPPGSQGPMGPQGPAGVGVAGPRGLQGPQGIQGEIGPAGAGVPGPAGPRGFLGPQGDQGLQGIQGVKGDLHVYVGDATTPVQTHRLQDEVKAPKSKAK